MFSGVVVLQFRRGHDLNSGQSQTLNYTMRKLYTSVVLSDPRRGGGLENVNR